MLELLRDLVEGGFVGQAIIATLLVGGYVALQVAGKPIDPGFAGMVGLVVGWFFRSQAQVIADRKATKATR